MKYKHYAAKTTFEEFHAKNLAGFMEKYLIPEVFSPNFITIMGQIPSVVLIIYLVTQIDAKMDGSTYPPSEIFFAGALTLQWFSWFDIADGGRARRLKCGSPVGRIVDEAFDLINQAITCTLMLYGL